MDRPTVALNWGTPRRARTATFIRLSTQSDRLANVESSRALRPSKTRRCPSRFSVQPLLQHQPRRLLYTPPCLRPLRCVAKPVLRRQLQWLCVFLSRQPLLAAFSPCREPTEAKPALSPYKPLCVKRVTDRPDAPAARAAHPKPTAGRAMVYWSQSCTRRPLGARPHAHPSGLFGRGFAVCLCAPARVRRMSVGHSV